MTSASPADRDGIGFREAAILVRALGEDQAARSAMRLWPTDARRLGAALSGLGRVSASQVDAVLGGFLDRLGTPGSPTRGDAAAEYLKSLVNGGRAASGAKRRRLISDGLRWMSVRTVARSLGRRRRRSITGTALAYLEPVRAAAVLEALTADERVRVLLQLAGMEGSGRWSGAKAEPLGGPDAARAILRHLDAALRGQLMEAVRSRAPALAQHLAI